MCPGPAVLDLYLSSLLLDKRTVIQSWIVLTEPHAVAIAVLCLISSGKSQTIPGTQPLKMEGDITLQCASVFSDSGVPVP
jgi:hypothetical protein